MNRERVLKVVLVLVGLLFVAGTYPMAIMVRSVLQPHDENSLQIVLRTADEAMMLSLYVTLGIFLLLAARDTSAHRSVIALLRGRVLRTRLSWLLCLSRFQPHAPSG